MRFLSGLLLNLIFAFILYWLLPWLWWSAIIPALILGFGLQMKSWLSFLCGFLSVGLFWGIMSLWLSYSNNFILLEKIDSLLPFGSTNGTLIAVSILGAILGGLGMLSAKQLRDIISGPVVKSKNKKKLYR
jgi:hypothetical protein